MHMHTQMYMHTLTHTYTRNPIQRTHTHTHTHTHAHTHTASSWVVWPAMTVLPSTLGKEKEAFRKKDGRSRPDYVAVLT